MKKILLMILAFFVTITLLFATFGNIKAEYPSPELPEPPEYAYKANLYAGKPKQWELGEAVGVVKVWNDVNNLYARFETDHTWCMTEVHLQIANDELGIPQKNGNPTPGQFAINEKYDDCLPIRGSFSFDLGENWSAYDELVVAAHAVVAQPSMCEVWQIGEQEIVENDIYTNYADEFNWFNNWFPVQNSAPVEPLTDGVHVFNFKHTAGDGTAWDWIRLEKSCLINEETAWAGDKEFTGANWARYFRYQLFSATIEVCKEDTNGNSIPEWVVSLDGDEHVTGEDGCYDWTVYGPTTYTAVEEEVSGWTPQGDVIEEITIKTVGESQTHTFVNFKNVEVSVCKQDEQETPISEWTVYLDGDERVTDFDGCYTWTVTEPGTYTAVEETRDYWTVVEDPECVFTVASGDSPYICTFVNREWEELLLENKNTSWVIQSGDGVNGVLKYDPEGDKNFEFRGYGLVENENYSLISYKEPNGTGSYVLGSGKTNEFGDVQISGSVENLMLYTYPSGNEYEGQTGAKIWLVPSGKLSVTNDYVTSFSWSPWPGCIAEFLFETELINL